MDRLEVCALASGSNGNCYYLGNDTEAVLVDAGLSARQLQLRIAEKGIDQKKIKAILITHEHSDHCRGARVLSKRLNIPVYLTKKTYLTLSRQHQPADTRWFEPNQTFQLGEFEISAFSKLHDAVDACSFLISYAGKNVGVMTDIGNPCEQVKTHLGFCHVVFLETNYDEDMLQNGPYPYYLKERVASDLGHLSNIQAFNLVKEHAGESLKTIFLSHISGENNTPEKAYSVFESLKEKYHVELTSRHQATEVFSI